jgi:hypothetical protein
MPGSVAANFRVANRAEILADYLFSQWGTVTPVRRQDDIGADLYCTLLEQAGRRGCCNRLFFGSGEVWVAANALFPSLR